MSYRSVDVLEVWMWDHEVGAIGRDPASGRYVFAFTPDWVERGVELSPLVMPLRTTPYDISQWPELEPEHFNYLPPLLADSLPDAFGNALVNAWMIDHGVASDQITPLDRLAYAADRALGALEVRPPARDESDDVPSAVELADLVLAARRTVRGELTSDGSSRTALEQLIHVGTSAGGARAKAVVAFNPETYQIKSAYTTHEPGFEQWIIKLDGVSSAGMDGHGGGLGDSAPYGRIEFAYSLMARAAGITMEDCLLLAEGPRRHFMTRRFDRGPLAERHHVISLCALRNLDPRLVGVHSYDQYLRSVRELGLDLDDLAQAYRRMVFNVMALNRDDHTKNFSFRRRQGARWELSVVREARRRRRPNDRHDRRPDGEVPPSMRMVSAVSATGDRDRHEARRYETIRMLTLTTSTHNGKTSCTQGNAELVKSNASALT